MKQRFAEHWFLSFFTSLQVPYLMILPLISVNLLICLFLPDVSGETASILVCPNGVYLTINFLCWTTIIERSGWLQFIPFPTSSYPTSMTWLLYLAAVWATGVNSTALCVESVCVCVFHVADISTVFPMCHELIGCWGVFLPVLLFPWQCGHGNLKHSIHVSLLFACLSPAGGELNPDFIAPHHH